VNQAVKVRYDVDVFCDICRQAELNENLDERMQLYRKAINQYSHPYAPAIDGIWTAPIRTKLYLKYERAALEVATFDLQQNKLQSCLDTCTKLLEIEPGQERAWQICMLAHSELGDRGSIVKVYEQCKTNLSRSLNLKPSQETEDLYQNLIA
ncbi:MAG: bacterial transcriptional activator domain-containing protein, partial [Anaerolineales bacterium]|nr:bacterial transcriptional activator domain-containing protein [Anaerolineales bacterium]